MNREFKVGDKVFDVGTGNGIVTSVSNGCSNNIISVKFENKDSNTYTSDGRYFNSDLYPTLFHGHDLIIEVKEPEYEYQILSWFPDEEYFGLSPNFYKNVNEFLSKAGRTTGTRREIFEPSKRLVKRG